ncbi:hypothetical protein [Phytohabitans rumicis]|uniref:Uncharacterized protein n=1 Tax=Phytohabitans rumicis TaxID=1076125 RepID=A0A6V8L0W1_9ACTN|nr:hypothetical protein [Phytohabitans rumicis]GFJ87726.1 hypothetical protein Prum_013680 [Phytohabitans rumicis]
MEAVVDAHHHLWNRARHRQHWIDPQTMAATAGVTQTVVVQAVSSLEADRAAGLPAGMDMKARPPRCRPAGS